MSSSFKLDRNNNIINNSNFILVSEKAALVQDIKTLLYMYKGEYPYNINKGIDYIAYLQNDDETGLLAAMQQRILEDTRVTNVTFESAKESNNLKIVLTITGGEESWNRNNNGLELQDTSSILEQVQNVFLTAFPNLNIEPSTPQGQIITAITELFTKAQTDIVEFANVILNGGTGIWLDAYCKTNFGIIRKTASKGSVTALISGTIGTIIPAGFIAKSGDYEFETISEYIIASSGNVYAELFAKDDGDFSIDAGTLTTIITPVSGVERITNPYESVSGSDTETDNELRLRASNSLTYRATSIFDGMLAQILQLSGVSKIAGYENNTKNTVLYKNIVLEPNSVAVVVKGGDLQAIGKVILENKTVGADVMGDIDIKII